MPLVQLAHHGVRGGKDTAPAEHVEGLHGVQLDPLADDVHELAGGQVVGHQKLVFVNAVALSLSMV